MEPTSDETQPPGAPAGGRRRANPDTTAFWLKDLKAPVIREPSPVLGARGVAPAPPVAVPPEPVDRAPAAPEPAAPEPVTTEPVTPEPVTPEPVTPIGITPAPLAAVPATPASGVAVPAPRLRTSGTPARPAVDLTVPVTRPVVASAPLTQPVTAPMPEPTPPTDVSAPADPDGTTARARSAPLPRRRDLAREAKPARIRPTTVLGAGGALLVAVGLGVPFLLNGPFGNDSVTITQSSPTPSGPVAAGTATSRVTTYTPTASGPATPVPTTTAQTRTRTRTATRTARATAAPTTVRTVTKTLVPTKTPKPTTTQPTTRPGQVFIDSTTYAGRPLLDVRNELLSRGVTPVDNWVYGTGKAHSTVIEIRPSGWVADRSIVYVWVAAS